MTEKELGLKYNRAAVSLYKTPKVIRLTEEMRDVIVGAIQKAGSKMELARQTGVHEFTIYCWLCNANNPRRSSFNRIKNWFVWCLMFHSEHCYLISGCLSRILMNGSTNS